MEIPLFHVPMYFYEIEEWERKKKALLSRVYDKNLKYHHLANFKSDRHTKKNRYSLDFEQIFEQELNKFKEEAKISRLRVSDVWTIKYTQRNEGHCPHNHGSRGYSGLMYLEYDPKVHEPTKFIGPWNDPVTDMTKLTHIRDARPGVMYIWPSSLIHYADSMNTNKLRMITAWDMDVM